MLSVHRFRLITLSPIHIGGRFQAIFPFEYIVDNGRYFVVREDKLASLLQKKGLMGDFLKRFEQAGFSLTDYLRERNLLSAKLLEEISLYSCSLARINLGGTKQVRPFTRDAWQRPFIPGTAIKGPMRTALWFYAIKGDSEQWHRRIREAVERGKGRGEGVDDELDKEILQGYRLRNKTRSPHSDILRVIKVSDAQPWERDSLLVGEEETIARGKPRPDLSTFLEYQEEAKETVFSLVFDEGLLEEFKKGNRMPFENLEEFLGMVDGFYREVAMFESREGEEKGKEFYDWLLEKTKGAGYLMRIGWGGGLPSLTVWLALPDELRRIIRERFFKRGHTDKFPLTRRFLKRKEGVKETYTPFGWVILKEVR